jgi:hypothetical protein
LMHDSMPICQCYYVMVLLQTRAVETKDSGGRQEGCMFRVEGKLPDRAGMQARLT